MDPPAPNLDHHSISPEYTTTHDPHEPVLSPNYANLHGLPPTLFLTSSRDVLLSGTANMQRAWARDGVPTQFTVLDGLPTPSGTKSTSPNPAKPTPPWPASSPSTSQDNGTLY